MRTRQGVGCQAGRRQCWIAHFTPWPGAQPTSGPTASPPPSYPAGSKRRWWAHAQRDNGILEAVISPEVFIHENPSGITCRSFLDWPISIPGDKYRKELQRPLASRMDPNREWYPYQGRARRRGLSIAPRQGRSRAHHRDLWIAHHRGQLIHNHQDQ